MNASQNVHPKWNAYPGLVSSPPRGITAFCPFPKPCSCPYPTANFPCQIWGLLALPLKGRLGSCLYKISMQTICFPYRISAFCQNTQKWIFLYKKTCLPVEWQNIWQEKEEKLFLPTSPPHNLGVSDFSCYCSPKKPQTWRVLVQELVENCKTCEEPFRDMVAAVADIQGSWWETENKA